MKLNRLSYVLPLISMSTSAWANIATVESQTFSQDCGDVTSEVGPDSDYDNPQHRYVGESLRLFFNNFVVQAEKPGDYLRVCNINANILVPPGYRFMAVRASAEGFYQITPVGRNTGGIKVNYTVQPGNLFAERVNSKPFTGSGDIHCKADLVDAKFTGCYNKPTRVNLATHLAMWINHQTDGFSTMQLDASRRSHNLYWSWQLQSCKNYFDQKQFDSAYVAYNGQTYGARINIDLDRGTYTSSAGFEGQLTNLQNSDDGLTLKGNWAAGTANGYFNFSIVDVSSGEFRGTWGDSQGNAFAWTGRYAGRGGN